MNQYLQKQNLDILRNQPKRKPRILFVADCFVSFGGSESRIASQIKSLESFGYDCYVLTQYNQNERLLKFKNLFLRKFFAFSFERILLEIITVGQFDHVEFVFKSWRYLKSTNINRLKAKAQIGASFLNITTMPNQMMEAFDYQISYSNRLFPKSTVIKNWLPFTINRCWTYQNQKRALYIARLAPGKMVTLKNFLDICEHYGLAYDVMGPITKPHHREVRQQLLRIPTDRLLPASDTIAFLKDNPSRYCLVAGEGFIPAEAASLGFPVLVLSQKLDGRSTILTNDNFDLLHHWNFVINNIPNHACLGGVDHFFNALLKGNLSNYRIDSQHFDLLSVQEAMKKYLPLLKRRTPKGP